MKKFFCALLAALLLLTAAACEGGDGQANEPERVVNTVVCVSFADVTETDGKASALVEVLNNSPTGMNAFFLAESLGKCDVQSYYSGGVRVENGTGYYKPKTPFNRDGYDGSTVGGKSHVDSFYREQALVREALSLIAFDADYNPDGDGDGVADAVTLVINSEFDTSRNAGDILWPHKSELYSYGRAVENSFYIPENYFEDLGVDAEDAFELPLINGAAVEKYAIVSASSTVGEICHEFSHILGKPDYYSYVETSGLFAEYDNIGKYELMGASVGDIPQFSLAYVRYKLGWLEDGRDIEVLTESQRVTLQPVTAGGVQAVKLMPYSFYDNGEFLMVEARRKESGKFDGEVNATGLIVYSVKPENAYITSGGTFGSADLGNMYGDGNFEIELLLNDFKLNYFNSKYNSTGSIRLTDGTDSGISLSGITENADGSFTFDVTFSRVIDGEDVPPEMLLFAGGGVANLQWNVGRKSRVTVVAFKATPQTAAAYAAKLLPGAKDILNGRYGGYEVLYTVGLDGASRQYVPNVSEEAYFAAVCVDGDGDVVFEEYFHVTVGSDAVVGYGFFDLVKVLFKVGNPAFIASFVFIGLCVLVGLAVLAAVLIKRKMRITCPDKP